MSIRTERVAGEIQQALARLFQTEFGNVTDSLITVTKVRMAPDLKSGAARPKIFSNADTSHDSSRSPSKSFPGIAGYFAGENLNKRGYV